MNTRLTTVVHAVTVAARGSGHRIGGSRWGRRPAVLLAAALMLMWAWAILGPNLPFLLILLLVASAAIWTMRHRRDIAYSLGIAAVTAAAPAAAVIAFAASEAGSAPAAAAALTGFIMTAPLPTVTAWILRPPILSRPRNALVGSLVLLLGAVVALAVDGRGVDGPVLVASLGASTGLIWVRNRRAVLRRLKDLPRTGDGWTYLGRRVLPNGDEIYQAVIRRGYAVAATLTTASSVSSGALTRSVNRALGLAGALGLPTSHVHPVLVAPRITTGYGAHQVSAPGGRATVLVAAPTDVLTIARLAPNSRRRYRRCLYTAAALSLPERRPA